MRSHFDSISELPGKKLVFPEASSGFPSHRILRGFWEFKFSFGHPIKTQRGTIINMGCLGVLCFYLTDAFRRQIINSALSSNWGILIWEWVVIVEALADLSTGKQLKLTLQTQNISPMSRIQSEWFLQLTFLGLYILQYFYQSTHQKPFNVIRVICFI